MAGQRERGIGDLIREGDRSFSFLLAQMNADSIEASNLDPEKLMLVRIAALVAMDAPPASHLVNLAAAAELEISEAQVREVLSAVAPIVGTPRVVSAAGKIARAVGIAIAVADADAQAEVESGNDDA